MYYHPSVYIQSNLPSQLRSLWRFYSSSLSRLSYCTWKTRVQRKFIYFYDSSWQSFYEKKIFLLSIFGVQIYKSLDGSIDGSICARSYVPLMLTRAGFTYWSTYLQDVYESCRCGKWPAFPDIWFLMKNVTSILMEKIFGMPDKVTVRHLHNTLIVSPACKESRY